MAGFTWACSNLPPSFLSSPLPCLQIRNEADACLRVSLASGDNAGYQFKTHPNIDKATYRWAECEVESVGVGLREAGLTSRTAGLPCTQLAPKRHTPAAAATRK